jgi:hypothetical protein
MAVIFWVSIGSDPILYFTNREEAREFFKATVARARRYGMPRFQREHKETLAVLAGD